MSMRIRSILRLTLAAVLLAAPPAIAQNQSPAASYPMGPWIMGGGYAMMGPGMMGGGFAMMGMLSQYPDGYIAFLKAELGIAQTQEGAFDTFARALRTQSDALKNQFKGRGAWGMGPGMMMGRNGQRTGPGMMGGMWRGGTAGANGAWQPMALPDALEQDVKDAEARLNAAKALRDAAKPFYAALTSEQKDKANRLFACPMCNW